jgi:hypothetical protein
VSDEFVTSLLVRPTHSSTTTDSRCPSEPLRVFISYARKDGTRLAQRLQSDLSKEGFDA